MTMGDFKILVKGMKAVYTSERFLPDADSIKVWYRMLSDISYEDLNIAIQKHIATSEFPPTIADLRKGVSPKLPDWSEGWGQVIRAIRKFGYTDPKGAMEFFDDVTRECVKRLGWYDICTSENLAVDRANFRMAYEDISKRKNEQVVLPEHIQKKLEQLNYKMLEEKL